MLTEQATLKIIYKMILIELLVYFSLFNDILTVLVVVFFSLKRLPLLFSKSNHYLKNNCRRHNTQTYSIQILKVRQLGNNILIACTRIGHSIYIAYRQISYSALPNMIGSPRLTIHCSFHKLTYFAQSNQCSGHIF